MLSIEEQLGNDLAQVEGANLRRKTLSAPQEGDWVTNDLFGLSHDPHVIARAAAALEKYGVGSRASRVLGGDLPLHLEAEDLAAEWLAAEAALLFPSGWQACAGILGTLVQSGDVLLCDRLLHASLIDGARLTRARRIVSPHLDLDALEVALRGTQGARRRLIVTEGIFSMDGTSPDLVALSHLAAKYNAWLLIDEAHSAGVLGPSGRGAWAQACANGARQETLVARIVTGGKALGAAGAFVLGSSSLRALMLTRARSFLFTTAPPPAVTGALLGSLERIESMDNERVHVRLLAQRLASQLGLPAPAGAIVPIPIGDTTRAMELSKQLRNKGFELRAVRPPTVPEGESRIRVVVHARQSMEEIDALAKVILDQDWTPPPMGIPPLPRARGLWVIGTDTDVGKTVASAAILHALSLSEECGYCKPIQTGTQEPGGDDTLEIQRLAPGVPTCTPHTRLPLPASPHEAAAHANEEINPSQLNTWLDEQLAKQDKGTLVIEPAGGLHVPITPDFLTSDWIAQRQEPLVLVARSGLGTLNHTLLTLEALSTRNLRPLALILVGPVHDSNRKTLSQRAPCPTFELPTLTPLSRDTLRSWAQASGLADALHAPTK